MGRKGPSELTKHEVQLLTIAAKFMAAMKRVEETGLSPMELDIMDTKINQEVRTINSIFAGYGIHSKTPRVHLIIQVIGTEWQSAAIEDCYPDWFILTTEYITTLCEYVSSENPDWHLKLSSLDLNSYLDGLHPSKMWWLEENTIPQMPSESTVDNLPSQSSSSRLTLAPPSASTDPPEPLDPPATPPPVHNTRGTVKARAIQTRSSDRPADAPSKRHTAPYALQGTKRDSPGNPGEASETVPHQNPPVPRVEVEQASPPRPTQRQRTDAGDIVAYGNDRCGPCIHFGDSECKAQANKRSIACVKCAQRHKPCEPPATWAIPLHRAMEARSTPSMGAGSPGSFGDSRVDALECKVESLTSKLGDVTQTVDRVLFEVVNTRQDSHDTRLMVGKLLSHQGIESTSIPGVGMPPTNRRSVSPGVQSTSSVGAHMSGLTLSDIRPPSSLSSAPPSRSRQPSGESVASGGRLTPSGISGGSSSAGPVA
ncbi:hypothetical protein H4582DRAFT_2063952 [Lactarius indigo]|nr:hypothetical protein H4582DRAFT_2063952 [Lactarius indigo]